MMLLDLSCYGPLRQVTPPTPRDEEAEDAVATQTTGIQVLQNQFGKVTTEMEKSSSQATNANPEEGEDLISRADLL